MLSYQHIYHAGNMADVQKHLWLLSVLEYLSRKDKPFYWIDTHSGRGAYDLNAPEAQKLAEYKDGIAALFETIRQSQHTIIKLYAQEIIAVNGGAADEIKAYPGSAMIAAQMLRGKDKLAAFELHPKEFLFLQKAMALYKGAVAKKQDGYNGLKALIPPPIRRGGVLIDPSYEIKEEYMRVADAVGEAVKKWPQGTYMVWYPILKAGRHEAMCKALEDTAKKASVEFTRDEWVFEGVEKGMLGTGMAIVNTPFSCAATMEQVKQILLTKP